MEKTIKIGSVDFWPVFSLQHSIFYDIFKLCGYEIIIDNNDPDILFCSVFGNNHTKYTKPIKVLFSGENWGLPNFDLYNFAMTGYYIEDPRHYRLPLYVLYCRDYVTIGNRVTSYDQLSKPRDITKIKEKTKFCNFIYSNCDENRDGVRFRQEFFKKLSEYKQVDSGGNCLNNLGYKITNKLEVISDYKFTISMENSSHFNGVYGYTTEKIFEPMTVDSIPLYYGNKNIFTDFNLNSIVNYHSFNDINDMINKIIEIDNNDELYNQYLSEPFVSNYDTSPLNIDNLITFFKTKILNV
jgi:hypothetical protein